MASAFGHGIAAFGLGKLFPKEIMTRKVFTLGILSSILPDIDVIAFKFGVSWDSMWSHRGFTHSIFVAIIWTIIILILFHRKESYSIKTKLSAYYFLATMSHGILDAMTNGGNGIAFFAPFSIERYFLPWEVIQVSPIGIKNFFSKWGVEVLKSEFFYIVLPSLGLVLFGNWLNKNVYQ